MGMIDMVSRYDKLALLVGAVLIGASLLSGFVIAVVFTVGGLMFLAGVILVARVLGRMLW